MLRRLYDWTISLASKKAAQWWLAFIAFLESSIFPIPADVIFLPMALARPDKVWRYATIATIASVLGGIFGWYIGFHLYDAFGRPLLESMGKLDTFEHLRGTTSADAILLMLITSGIAHLPPMKVVTILSGAAGINIWLFIASAIVARGARFFFLAWLLKKYGEPIRHFIEKRLGLIAAIVAVVLILLFVAFKYLHG